MNKKDKLDKSKKKENSSKNIFDPEVNGSHFAEDLFGTITNYIKNINELPWNKLPKEGIFLIVFVFLFIIILFLAYRRFV